MSCSGTDIFGDNSCESGLVDLVEKTQNQDATAGNTNFSGNLTVNGLPVSTIGDEFRY